MRYINIETSEYPLSESDIRKRHPNTSFPNPFVPPAEYQPVMAVPRPPLRIGMQAIEGAPHKAGDKWFQSWVFIKQTARQRTVMNDALWAKIRKKRNELLSKTDWIVSVIDAPISSEMKEKWLEYRQALRDITKVADPSLVKWPSEPK